MWQNVVRDDRYLYYHGNISPSRHRQYILNILYMMYQDWSRWVVNNELEAGRPYMKAKQHIENYIPERDWEYWSGDWLDDDTLTVTGNITIMSQLFVISV